MAAIGDCWQDIWADVWQAVWYINPRGTALPPTRARFNLNLGLGFNIGHKERDYI